MKNKGSVILEWERGEGEPEKVIYYLNGRKLGQGDNGFELLLGQLRSLEPGATLIIRGEFAGTSGGDIAVGAFPFYERRCELDDVMKEGQLKVIYEIR